LVLSTHVVVQFPVSPQLLANLIARLKIEETESLGKKPGLFVFRAKGMLAHISV
jgi:hypothetical protein